LRILLLSQPTICRHRISQQPIERGLREYPRQFIQQMRRELHG
jgi:hypothetical protein